MHDCIGKLHFGPFLGANVDLSIKSDGMQNLSCNSVASRDQGIERFQFTRDVGYTTKAMVPHKSSVFLPGSIEMGKAITWQLDLRDFLQDQPITVHNPRRPQWNPNVAPVAKKTKFQHRVRWGLDALYRASKHDSSVHATISKLRALWPNLDDVLRVIYILGEDIIQKAGLVYQRILSGGPKFRPRHFRRHSSDISRQISPKACTVITAFFLLPSAQAAPPHISVTGIPVTNTFAGALAWIISCFQDGRTVTAPLYWTVYGCWALAALLALAFTASSIALEHRLRYFGVVVLMEGLVLAALVASSVSNVEEMVKHLKEWMPMATVLVASALPMAFNRVE